MYQAKNLSVLSYANGFTLWHYTTGDAAGELMRNNYFGAAADMLRAGDIIVVNSDTAANKPKAAQLHVETVQPGSVRAAAI